MFSVRHHPAPLLPWVKGKGSENKNILDKLLKIIDETCFDSVPKLKHSGVISWLSALPKASYHK